jgi:hypothetical protein
MDWIAHALRENVELALFVSLGYGLGALCPVREWVPDLTWTERSRSVQ